MLSRSYFGHPSDDTLKMKKCLLEVCQRICRRFLIELLFTNEYDCLLRPNEILAGAHS